MFPVTYCLAVAQRSCLCGPAHVSMACGPASNRPLRPIGTDVRIYYLHGIGMQQRTTIAQCRYRYHVRPPEACMPSPVRPSRLCAKHLPPDGLSPPVCALYGHHTHRGVAVPSAPGTQPAPGPLIIMPPSHQRHAVWSRRWLKLLRGGAHSASLVTITPNGADGQTSWHFFKQPWITHVAAPAARPTS